MRPQRTFTQEEINTIKALYEEGVNIKTIAKGFHCHPDKVSQFIKDNYGSDSLSVGRKSSKPKEEPKQVCNTDNKVINSPKPKINMRSNMLSMPEEYNVELVKRLKTFIRLELVPNINIGGLIFDVGIPELGIIIVSCPTEDIFNKWRSGIDGFKLSDILRENHYSSVDGIYKGDEEICDIIKRRYKLKYRFG